MSKKLVHSSTLLTFHGASFILHAHKRLDFDSEDIGRIIIELPSKLQENPTSESEKAPVMSPNAMSFQNKRNKRDGFPNKRDELFGN